MIQFIITKSMCEELQAAYRKLHCNNYAMLGDLHHFFYFTSSNFELYGLLAEIGDRNIVEEHREALPPPFDVYCLELWLSMKKYGLYHRKLRKKQIKRALGMY